MQNPSKFKNSQGKTPSYSSPPETRTPQMSLRSRQIKVDNRPARCADPSESKGMEMTGSWDSTLCTDKPLQPIASTDLAESSVGPFNKDQKELDEIMQDVWKLVRPLPPLLSPIQCSPAATPVSSKVT